MAGSLNNINAGKILVVGDIMLDTYFVGDINRISPEAPVPVFKKSKERSVLGGAANVAANLNAAEQDVSVMSIIGNDSVGDELTEKLERMGICSDLLVRLDDRNTTVKTRFLAGNNQQVIRMDVEDSSPISSELCEKMLSMLREKIKSFDLIRLVH